jgi:bacterial/archaeal transporter family-2 protein
MPQSFWLYFVLVLLVGVASSVQSVVNSQMGRIVQNPLLASLISFGSGFFVLLVYTVFVERPVLPAWSVLRSTEWWKWVGGVLGVYYVLTVIMSVPKIGTANVLTLIVAGQLLTALAIEHFGWLNVAPHPVNAWRMLGACLIVVGVYLVVRN